MSVRIPGVFPLKESIRQQWFDACEEVLDADLYRWALVLAEDGSSLFFHGFSAEEVVSKEVQASCFSGSAVLRTQSARFALGDWKSSITTCEDGVLVQSALPFGCSLHLLAHKEATPGTLWSQSAWLQSSLTETLR